MPSPRSSLSYELHKLTARLDRAADALLRDQAAMSYPRFLALFAVRQGAENQRALSRWLGQSEPSTSRMVGVLARAGWLEVTQTLGTGNRRHLKLTEAGSELVATCVELLENRFSELVARAGVGYEPYLRNTRRLLAQLDEAGLIRSGTNRSFVRSSVPPAWLRNGTSSRARPNSPLQVTCAR